MWWIDSTPSEVLTLSARSLSLSPLPSLSVLPLPLWRPLPFPDLEEGKNSGRSSGEVFQKRRQQLPCESLLRGKIVCYGVHSIAFKKHMLEFLFWFLGCVAWLGLLLRLPLSCLQRPENLWAQKAPVRGEQPGPQGRRCTQKARLPSVPSPLGIPPHLVTLVAADSTQWVEGDTPGTGKAPNQGSLPESG